MNTISNPIVIQNIESCIQKGYGIEVVLIDVNEKLSSAFNSKGKHEDYFYTEFVLKTINHLKAISLLVEHDLFHEALKICRSVIENYISVRYATVINDDCFLRYYNYHNYYKGEMLKTHEKHIGQVPADVQTIHEIKEKHAEVCDDYKNKSWRRNFRQMCEDIDKRLPEGDPIVGTSIQLYESAYSVLSNYVHNNPLFWNQQIEENRLQFLLELVFHTSAIACRVFQMIAHEYGVILT